LIINAYKKTIEPRIEMLPLEIFRQESSGDTAYLSAFESGQLLSQVQAASEALDWRGRHADR